MCLGRSRMAYNDITSTDETSVWHKADSIMTVHTAIYQHLIARSPDVALQWHTAIALTSFTPTRAAVVRQRLRELTEQIIDLLCAEPFDAAGGEQIGAALVALHYVQP